MPNPSVSSEPWILETMATGIPPALVLSISPGMSNAVRLAGRAAWEKLSKSFRAKYVFVYPAPTVVMYVLFIESRDHSKEPFSFHFRTHTRLGERLPDSHPDAINVSQSERAGHADV